VPPARGDHFLTGRVDAVDGDAADEVDVVAGEPPRAVQVTLVFTPAQKALAQRGLGVGLRRVDGDVEVKLLRTVRIGKARRIVLRRQLKGEPTPHGIRQHHPGVILLVKAAAEDAGIECGQLSRVPAVDDGGPQLSQHGLGIVAIAPRQTAEDRR